MSTISDLVIVKNDSSNSIQNNKNEKKIDKFTRIINKSLSNNKLNLLHYSYLNSFSNLNEQSIINIKWFIEIINDICCDTEKKEIKKTFSKYFKIKKKNLDISTKIKKGVENIETIQFTKEQLLAVNKVLKFLMNKEMKTFGLYGYAGTGKTTTMVEIMYYLLKNKYINSVVLTAPTNKAVTVIKTKFKPYIDNIYKEVTGNLPKSNQNLEQLLDDLYSNDIKIDFITIHKLLKFKTEYGTEGELIFTRSDSKKKKTSLISNYEIVVIDECSMISLDILDFIFKEIRIVNMKNGSNYKKVPKIIFTGDPAQLPPVNEPNSFIFIKNKDELSKEEYIKYITRDDLSCVVSNMDNLINTKRMELVNNILQMKTFTLKNVVRSRINAVTEVCYEIRNWVNNKINIPDLMKYSEYNGVEFYEYDKKDKLKSNWFNKCIDYIKDNKCSIILTWTNKQSEIYNNEIRKILFKNQSHIKFIKNDILMLTEYYSLDIGENSDKFYTSEQIQVYDTDEAKFVINNFIFKTNSLIKNDKNSNQIVDRCRQFINFVNKKIYNLIVNCWELCVKKIGSESDNFHVIRVLSDESINEFNKIKLEVSGYILDFTKKMISNYKEKQKFIEKNIIKQFWAQWHTIFISPFANVNYGYSITCHKGQGSNFYNVFTDVHDILKNGNSFEYKKCLYTALTRTINELHLLI